MTTNYIPLFMGGLGLVAAFVVYRLVASYPAGEGKVADIAKQIQSGAMAFMRREYVLVWGVRRWPLTRKALAPHCRSLSTAVP